jgi:hypothetical protein
MEPIPIKGCLHMAVRVIKLVLQPEVPLIGHNLLYGPGLKEA